MRSLLSHFARPNRKTIGAAVAATGGMLVAFKYLTLSQAEAGGAFVMTLLALFKPSRPKSKETHDPD